MVSAAHLLNTPHANLREKPMDRNRLLLSIVSDALRSTRGTPESRLPTEPVRIDSLATDIRDAGLAEEAFSLVVSILDQERDEDRVYLSDLAEWLILSPVTVRDILQANDAAGDLAA